MRPLLPQTTRKKQKKESFFFLTFFFFPLQVKFRFSYYKDWRNWNKDCNNFFPRGEKD